MDKQTYYISVQSGSILQDRNADEFEFQIEATEKEIEQLLELFEYREAAENANFRRSFIPGIPYHQDEANDIYDAGMRAVYQMVHRLGTEETKKQIEDMGLA